MYRTILVPLDGSRLAESVLPIVARLAESGTRVILLHVVEPGSPRPVHGEPHLQSGPDAQRYLDAVASRLRRSGVDIVTHCHEPAEGDVPRSIAQHAQEESVDLVVVCTHGHGGLRQFLSGSVAQQVLRRGEIPVLLVRAASREAMPEAFAPRKILVPLDGTAASEGALPAAGEMSTLLHAPVHLVLVVSRARVVPNELHAIGQAMPTAARAALEMEEAEAYDYLDSVARSLRTQGIEVTTEVRTGDPQSALADEATESDVGLVVVATHGRAGIQALWAGSVTTRLLARTQAPLLLLRTVEG